MRSEQAQIAKQIANMKSALTELIAQSGWQRTIQFEQALPLLEANRDIVLTNIEPRSAVWPPEMRDNQHPYPVTIGDCLDLEIQCSRISGLRAWKSFLELPLQVFLRGLHDEKVYIEWPTVRADDINLDPDAPWVAKRHAHNWNGLSFEHDDRAHAILDNPETVGDIARAINNGVCGIFALDYQASVYYACAEAQGIPLYSRIKLPGGARTIIQAGSIAWAISGS